MTTSLFQKLAFVGAFLTLLIIPSDANDVDRSIIGDYSSVSEMEPEVVIDYLATCAGRPINTSSCLVSTLIETTFGSEKWGDRCIPFLAMEIGSIVSTAKEACPDADEGDFTTVLGETDCFAALCDDNAAQNVEAKYVQAGERPVF